MVLLEDYFGVGGLLAEQLDGFVDRPQQLEMASVVSEAIAGGDNVFVEAGTGTGKTLSYLVPLFLEGKRALVATGTRMLQDQLRFQDLPLMGRLFPGRRIALLKGRSNYLCPYRLDKHLKVFAGDHGVMTTLVRLRDWAQRSRVGDLAEAGVIEDRVLPLVTSSRDNCLGTQCPRFDACPLYEARARASAADVVVVNHHLLFADLALKEDNVGTLLPEVDVVVVDEAHQVPEIARQFFDASVSSRRFTDLIEDLRAEMALLGNDDADLAHRVTRLELVQARMRDALHHHDGHFRDWFCGKGREVTDAVDFALGELLSALDHASVRSQAMAQGQRRTRQLADDFVLLTEPVALSEYVHWIDRTSQGFTIHLSPVDLASTIGHLFADASWIFCSATMSVDGSFTHIRNALGIDSAVERRFASPFDFRQQARAWLPDDLPDPGTDAHTQALVRAVQPVLNANLGRTFFLFTSYRAMHLAKELLPDAGRTLMQGAMPRHELLQKFREIERSILFATHGFWQGVDVRGAGLNCVIIDKLPFASPDEPLSRATMDAIDSAGGNGFLEYMLPRAIIDLRQGFGRLVRSESDQGLFILGDPRIHSRRYGGVIMSSLPTMEWVDGPGARCYVEQISEYSGN
ncbi:MAG: ATP-dependent DNA helicase [Proteobacteria bacterium]|nr:ATP-dependent DNA helicase [Pseudomonadota bacterium]